MHQQSHHQHAQQAAAAAASAAQQQHYNRIAANHNSAAPSIASGHGQDSMMETVSEENRRTLNFIADLLNEDTREAALLELSKKREQVPELALILWHSFGMFESRTGGVVVSPALTYTRCHDFASPRDYLCLHTPQPVSAYRCRFKSSLQRTGASTMCRISQRD
jgi:hypothetical protein